MTAQRRDAGSDRGAGDWTVHPFSQPCGLRGWRERCHKSPRRQNEQVSREPQREEPKQERADQSPPGAASERSRTRPGPLSRGRGRSEGVDHLGLIRDHWQGALWPGERRRPMGTRRGGALSSAWRPAAGEERAQEVEVFVTKWPELRRGGGASSRYWALGPAGWVLISPHLWRRLRRANPWVKDPKVSTAFSQNLVCSSGARVGGERCRGNRSRSGAARFQQSYE